jgi:Domain of unknown function (DUF3854)
VDLLSRAHVCRVSGGEAMEEFGVNLHGDSGLCFPYYSLPNDTAPRRISARVRRDNPPRDSSGKLEGKYVSAYGDVRHLYFPPCDPAWIASPSTPCFFVEAEKSALAILAWSERHNRPLIAVGLGGCHGWSGTIGKAVSADGERVDVKGALSDLDVAAGRKAYVLFDSNSESNPAVFSARKKFIHALRSKGCTDVRVLILPGGEGVNGPDDFLAKFGDSKFFDLFETGTKAVSEAGPDPLAMPDMSEQCLGEGYLADICRNEMAAWPRAYSYLSILTHASTLIHDRGDTRTNIFGVKVGPVGTAKTECDSWAANLLGIPASNIVSAYCGSGEQFVHLFSDACGNPRLYAPDELAHTLLKMGIDRSSFALIFNRAWSQDRFVVTMSRFSPSNPPIFDCHLSLSGGIVSDVFEDLFAANTIAGFYDRILFGHCPTGWLYDYRGAFPDSLRSTRFKTVRAPRIAPNVWDEVSDWRKQDPSLGRIIEIGLRAAVISASFDGKTTLNASDLQPARAMVSYQKRIRDVLRPNRGVTVEGKITDSILNYLGQLRGGGVTARTLFTGTNAYRLGVRTAEQVLRVLVANGTVVRTDGKRTDLYSIPLDGQP